MNAWVIGIAGPLLLFAGTAIGLWAKRKRERAAGLLDQAQAAKVVQGMAIDLLEPLKAKIEDQKRQIRDLGARLDCLEGKVSSLRLQVREEQAAREAAEAELLRLKAS